MARSDGVGVVQLLIGRPWPDHALQLIGDAVQVALRQGVKEAPGLAGQCVASLRARGWEGDEELADSLEARLGTAPSRLLRPLAVDLEELATVLEGDPIFGGGRIDLQTGEVWPKAAIEYVEEIGEENEDEADDSDRWLLVDCEGSRSGYRDMGWSSPTSTILRLRIGCESRSAAGERFAGSRSLCIGGLTDDAVVCILRLSPARPGTCLARL